MTEDWHTIGATIFVILLAMVVIAIAGYVRYSWCIDAGFTEDQCLFMIFTTGSN